MVDPSDRVPAEELELYRALVATHPDIEMKGGLKLPHTSHNGHMFSSLTKDGRVGIRLSDEDRAAFVARYDAIPFKNYGATIKEHVEIPAALLDRPEEMAPYLALAFEYAKSLPPK